MLHFAVCKERDAIAGVVARDVLRCEELHHALHLGYIMRFRQTRPEGYSHQLNEKGAVSAKPAIVPEFKVGMSSV